MQVMERNTSRDNAMEVSEFLNLKRKVKVRIQKSVQFILVSGLASRNSHGHGGETSQKCLHFCCWNHWDPFCLFVCLFLVRSTS